MNKTANIILDDYWANKLEPLCLKAGKLDVVRHSYATPLITLADLEKDPATKIVFAPYAANIKIRASRKDIFHVAIFGYGGATEEELYTSALLGLKKTSCNLVFATSIYRSMVVAPEETHYHLSSEVDETLAGLVEMAYLRSHLTFTRSKVVKGDPVPWNSELVPTSLRTVVDYCRSQGAYKPISGATAGHFAVKLAPNLFLTSIRKTNFNKLDEVGLVKVETDGDDNVIAYGSKPSVGGQSQRIVFRDHQEVDCILHFHSPIKAGSNVPVRSQREVECGSHACGIQTSQGLARFGNLKAVYLDNHGPNIVFNRNIDPKEVINFIESNFDLSQKTGGYFRLGQILDTNDTLEDFIDIDKQ